MHNLILPRHLKCIEESGLRVYQTPEGNLYPSITTCLGGSESEEKKESLKRWQDSLGHANAKAYTKKAADRGTHVHLLVERFLKGEDLQLNKFSLDDINSFTALKLKLKNLEVVQQEIALYSDNLGIAGRCDCIGYYKKVPSIIDFKTSNKNKTDKEVLDYKLQITFYAIAANEMYNTDIQQGVILMSSGTGFPLEWVFDIKEYVEPLKERINIFYSKFL